MPAIGANCHELRIDDGPATWRILYWVQVDAIVILEVFSKKTRTTPKFVVETARKRIRAYRSAIKEAERES